ncbi:hypothetical protein POPTR_011G071000v4 [Populus trichocarpa]|uniref:Uncharacterized protein n=1 Tax=Populus trichocarpa TaxID=3694 RepID=A0ACC0S8P3_POPTR|nr:hypothetical protein POPTR_011G071000v4 [Populus trichocarpa]
METIKCRSLTNNKSKIARTIQKVINLKSATRIASNNGIGICLLTPHNKFDQDDLNTTCKSQNSTDNHKQKDAKAKRRAILEALLAKLFASITTIKAAYAELQMAQNPYCGDAIQAADQAVVDELKQLSELKRSFFKNELHLSPQVTMMLAEIQEQQSLMKTYEITIKKLEADVEVKGSDVGSLKKQLDEAIAFNKSIEKRLNASGPLSMFDNIQFSLLNPSHFAQLLHYTLRSMKSFVKLMVREMEVAHWDIEAAAKAIEPENIVFAKPSHRCFVFESFVCKTMLEGFNHPNEEHQSEYYYFIEFKKIKSVNPKQFLTHNPDSSFARFTRAKYLQLVHAKLECSLFGNLNQRKLVNSGGFPDSAFFNAFVEMARRAWALNLLAFSFGEDVSIFQVSKNCRFSDVYMEAVTQDSELENPNSDTDLRVAFTVVPGFKIGKTVIQSQVYLSPVKIF